MSTNRSRSSGRRSALVWAAAALTFAGAMPDAAGAQQSASTAPALAFDGVTVVDVEQGRLLPAQRVVIVGNRIEAVGNARAVAIPGGAQVVDARGKYLIPGLWDFHVHPERPAYYYPLLLANGVTGFRNPGPVSDTPLPFDTLLKWRREIAAGTRLGPPRQVLSGPLLDTESRGEFDLAVNPDDAERTVDSLIAAGVDMIKMYDLTEGTYFAVAAAARRRGIPFGGHLVEVKAVDASDSGARIFDHFWGNFIDPDNDNTGDLSTHCWRRLNEQLGSVEQCQPIAERFRRNDTWVVPTLSRATTGISRKAPDVMWHSRPIADRLWKRDSAFRAKTSIQGNWLWDSTSQRSLARPPDLLAQPFALMAIVEQVGLPVVAGTDAAPGFLEIPGFALHAELAMYVAEGLSPLHALQSATLNPAKALHKTDSLGTVAPGKLADLVLLDADPLADITNTTTIRAVVANGRYFDRAALDKVLAEALPQ